MPAPIISPFMRKWKWHRLLMLVLLAGVGLYIALIDTGTSSVQKAEQCDDQEILPAFRPQGSVELAIASMENNPHLHRSEEWKTHLETTCKRLGFSTDSEQLQHKELNHILVDDNHKILYCQIAKVASSSIGKIFTAVAGLANFTDPNEIPSYEFHSKYNQMANHLDYLAQPDAVHRVKTYFKFMFVRDPLERVLSAYKNKFVKPPKTFRYLSNKIIRKYRTDLNKTGEMTFTEFVRYLTDPKSNIPTNGHWQPFYDLCRPCEVKFDYIGNLSTIGSDLREIFKINNITTNVMLPFNPPNARSLHQTELYLKYFFSQVPKDLVKQLYNLYYPDYAIFNISVPSAIQPMLK